MKNFKWFYLSAGMVAILLIGTVILKTSTENKITNVAAVLRQGYEAQPQYFVVEASNKKMFADTQTNQGYMFIIGLALAAAAGLPVLLHQKAPEGASSVRSNLLTLLICVASALFHFAPVVSKWGSSKYTTNLCVEKFRLYQNRLDDLFPEKDVDGMIDCDTYAIELPGH